MVFFTRCDTYNRANGEGV
jgi:hypothetical protein